jgi:hypothetical protein
MMSKKWFVNNMEAGSPPRHLPGESAENHEFAVGINDLKADIWTQDLPNVQWLCKPLNCDSQWNCGLAACKQAHNGAVCSLVSRSLNKVASITVLSTDH